ncbi:helix-turn-helix domain-containing protein [Streptococcus marmotae]|uniref:helix-turn-helix domain-containing protein n=1 Tax=Streptococcus marmotae TaxID=1825069 RepID=UPI000833AFF1|nr:XRE family transcriptional regulator [Streptococcus marmotae]
MLKQKLGQKIKRLRENKCLSRERFCGDESDLTVRQLARIENGDSLPSLVKLEYIHRKLGVPLSDLVDEEDIVLPQEYLALKLQLFKFNTYHNQYLIDKKDKLFSKIYEEFYELLPEDEQVIIDILQAIADVHHSSNLLYGQPIIAEYFEQVKRKKQYNLTDLMIIRLFFISLTNSDEIEYPKKLVHHFFIHSTRAFDYSDVYLIEYATIFYISCLNVLLFHHDFEYIELVFEILDQLLTYSSDVAKKSISFMLQAKYFYFCKKDEKTAEEFYTKAIIGAEFIDDMILREKLEKERERDRKAFAMLY